MKKDMKNSKRFFFEGVTVNGIPLRSFLNEAPVFDEERKEIEEVKREKVFTYKKPVIRAKTQTEKNGKVKRLMTSELNQKNYDAYMATFSKTNDLKGAVIAGLVCNQKKLSCADLADEIHSKWKELNPNKPWSKTNTNAIRTYIGQLKRSGLSEFLFVSRKKAGVPTIYGMTESGYNLPLGEALKLAENKIKTEIRKEWKSNPILQEPEKEAVFKPEEKVFQPVLETASLPVESQDLAKIRVEFLGKINIKKINVYLSILPETSVNEQDEP